MASGQFLLINAAHRTRRALGTLALLLAVFGWGLHYKTSLYHEQTPTRSAPPAKILSEAERPDTAQAIVFCAIKTPRVKHASTGMAGAQRTSRPPRVERQSIPSLQHTLAELRPRSTSYLRGPPLCS